MTKSWRHAVLAAAFIACGGGSSTSDGLGIRTSADSHQTGVIQMGDDVNEAVAQRVRALLTQVATVSWSSVKPQQSIDARDYDWVIAIGDTATAKAHIDAERLKKLGSEGYILTAKTSGKAHILVGRGNAIMPDTFHQGVIGNSYVAYAALEQIGYGFLHPLAPTIPTKLTAPMDFSRSEKPFLPVRGIHLHTMHPTELTHVLQGWGPRGINDAAGWESLVPEWTMYMEWLLANKQNLVQWVLLEADDWADFSRSAVRQKRFAKLNAIADAWGIQTAADAPLSMEQQHAFRLVGDATTFDERIANIRKNIDWLAGAGFDGLSSENGTSEFTHEDPETMLAYMNTMTAYASDTYGMPCNIKIHTSTGQHVSGYVDPVSGGELNINFLPYYADPRLGVMPHTVQHYGVDDPAPTYGNEDFSRIYAYAKAEAGLRQVLWYPETAYWVSFDVDVPLFLPLYAERRLADLRKFASDNAAIDGQVIFSSGWEWGYWLNDVIAARAAWNPHPAVKDDLDAYALSLHEALGSAGESREELVNQLVSISKHQRDILIYGKYKGFSPLTVVRKNGQAYVQGTETWDDVSDIANDYGLSILGRTQPDHLGLVSMKTPIGTKNEYETVKPLLAETRKVFADDATRLEKVPATTDWVAELQQAMRVTALRAEQVAALYTYVDEGNDKDLVQAQRALNKAATIVHDRELVYRTDPDRIAGWGVNPTVYRYGYLWTARSMVYWWRDEGKAVERPYSPCYLNFQDPLEIAFGEGLNDSVIEVVRAIAEIPFIGSIAECLTGPLEEPHYGDWR